jgi:hypothetical protein
MARTLALWEQGLVAWVEAVLSTYTVLMQSENVHAPDLPYATIRTLSDTPQGYPELVYTDETGGDGLVELTTIIHHRGTVSIELHSDTAHVDKNKLLHSLDNPTFQAVLEPFDVAVLGAIGGLNDAQVLRAIGFETYVVCDFEFAYADSVTTQQPTLAAATVEGDVSGEAIDTVTVTQSD